MQFITNQFEWSACSICELYLARWGIVRKLATEIAAAFHQEYYHGNGIYAKGEITALSCPLYHGLIPDSEKTAVEQKLIEPVDLENCICDFGILGAKYTRGSSAISDEMIWP